MPQDTRVNFPLEIVEKTLVKQGRCCAKCGLPLTYGYEVHHANGVNSDVSEGNCQLLHPRCHASEQYATLKAQREGVIKTIEGTLTAALSPAGMSGATLKEMAGLIDKQLSLINQVHGIEHFDLPLTERQEYAENLARVQLESYQEGYLDCLKGAIPSLAEGKVPLPIQVKKLAKQ
jgi:hypothetical protein